MAFPTFKSKPLGARLVEKGEALRTEQAKKADASRSFATLSAGAAQDSTTAGVHAAAVERAIAILDDAGVSL
ncbi:hypothetical protein [Microbacterium sp. B24]|uniref:hypothetical protein n=1 Tax=Microbacterium sp. B24 TaxID=95616 RepID=UPI000400E4A4|nr:hypothetical protein [Microbacterium sp. B24]